MKSLHDFDKDAGRVLARLLCASSTLLLLLLGFCLQPAAAQVVPSAGAGGVQLSAGVTGSGYILQYGQQRLIGPSAFVDADTRHRFGLEAEGRWLEFHQASNVHAETYVAGPRYHFNLGRFQVYVKGMAGVGVFHYPFGYATDSDLIVAPGAGLDYRLTRRIRWRAADFEYQYWPQFHYGAMSSVGVSTGIKIRIF